MSRPTIAVIEREPGTHGGFSGVNRAHCLVCGAKFDRAAGGSIIDFAIGHQHVKGTEKQVKPNDR